MKPETAAFRASFTQAAAAAASAVLVDPVDIAAVTIAWRAYLNLSAA